ncbi:hypothetical protein COC42_11565 [Sphingomonas spermidinifaciens]|uniref:Monooxygenase n=1 Tax=Sphingomonas spermidinifaciens TaxID=1141889 RepID=A0A2A4B2V2_9SPHN|nr:hypothetical protein [Sphingomonas spermidinifaciens]PCD02109.1 hypothetical protein COC42_11565 [Sphingomonas spermidinifaciens]
MSRPRVAVRGGGVAAAVAARLLRAGAGNVVVEGAARAGVPAVLLSDPARALLRDAMDAPALFEGLPRVERRVVNWGGASRTMPHAATLVPGAVLDMLGMPDEPGAEAAGAADFTILAEKPSDPPICFGERSATAVPVRLIGIAACAECRIEAVASGWLFLMPAAPPWSREGGRPGPCAPTVGGPLDPGSPPSRERDEHPGWLLAIGAAPELLLAESRSIAPRVSIAGFATRFDAAPRMAARLAGNDWLTCGSAALAFDPVCGDGVAQSAREGILAAAVVAAIAEGGDRAALIGHYEAMLIAAMRRHLQLSMPFYASGGTSDWWRTQYEALVEGHAHCTRLLARRPEPRFMLDGFRLVPRAIAA